jgi:transcriptional regulator with PAS, ATPase and Fis domain
MQTQVRLLRVLETGEFIRVGSSKVIKTNVRVVAATNENMNQAIASGKFREDLYYRLNTVPISLPPLRQRKEDIHLLFRKFSSDFADKYRMPSIRLKEDAVALVQQYTWPGNIRQLRNLVEQISVIETERELDASVLINYLPAPSEKMPAMVGGKEQESFSEREIMYKFLFDMKKDLTDLKKLVLELVGQGGSFSLNGDQTAVVNRIYDEVNRGTIQPARFLPSTVDSNFADVQIHRPTESFESHEEIEESLSLEDREKELIQKALEKHRGKRKYAALELGISERTLYRKIKEFNMAE